MATVFFQLYKPQILKLSPFLSLYLPHSVYQSILSKLLPLLMLLPWQETLSSLTWIISVAFAIDWIYDPAICETVTAGGHHGPLAGLGEKAFPHILCFSSSLRYLPRVLNRVQHLVTPWTITCQSSLSVGFSRQEYWGGLLFPPPGDLPNPGIEPTSPESPALQADSLPLELLGNI